VGYVRHVAYSEGEQPNERAEKRMPSRAFIRGTDRAIAQTIPPYGIRKASVGGLIPRAFHAVVFCGCCNLSTGIGHYFLTLTKVRPASDIKALPSHTTVKATTGRKEQFKTVAHPAAHAEEGLSSKKRGRR
jgi:hypothetical protein